MLLHLFYPKAFQTPPPSSFIGALQMNPALKLSTLILLLLGAVKACGARKAEGGGELFPQDGSSSHPLLLPITTRIFTIPASTQYLGVSDSFESSGLIIAPFGPQRPLPQRIGAFVNRPISFEGKVKNSEFRATTRCAAWDLLCQADWVITIQVRKRNHKCYYNARIIL